MLGGYIARFFQWKYIRTKKAIQGAPEFGYLTAHIFIRAVLKMFVYLAQSPLHLLRCDLENLCHLITKFRTFKQKHRIISTNDFAFTI